MVNVGCIPLFTASTAIAFHLYCSPNVEQEQNAICSTCSE